MSSPAKTAEKTSLTPADYKGRVKPIWCPGCGDFGVLNAITRSLAALGIEPRRLALASGIGCSSRIPGFVNCYGFHGAHGRALPVAVGIKLANPRLTVLALGGDGDGLSIGIGHFPHVARRNLDITYIMMDNRIYGLTKGQTSPTTLEGRRTKTSPAGALEQPLNPVELAVIFNATYVARGYSANLKELQDLITRGIQHRGFSMVHVLSPCVTFGKGSGFDYFGPRTKPLPDDHDPRDRQQALLRSAVEETIYTGVFYETERAEYVEQIQAIGSGVGRELDEDGPRIEVDRLIQRFS